MTIKRVADYCDRLTRLRVMYDEREFDPAEIDAELWRVCKLVWGHTPDDVDDEALPQDVQDCLDEIYENDASLEAQQSAQAQGYDLKDDQGQILQDWWWFTLMILGEQHGLMTSEHIAAARLKAEIQKFEEDSKAGVISGR
jgi:hypothetical protein